MPLLIAIGALVLRAFVRSGTAANVLDVVGLVALSWWAILELTSGVNPSRRMLGGLGCILVVAGVAAMV